MNETALVQHCPHCGINHGTELTTPVSIRIAGSSTVRSNPCSLCQVQVIPTKQMGTHLSPTENAFEPEQHMLLPNALFAINDLQTRIAALLTNAHNGGILTQTIIDTLHDELVLAAEGIAPGRSVVVQLYHLDQPIPVSLQEQAPNSQRMYQNVSE